MSDSYILRPSKPDFITAKMMRDYKRDAKERVKQEKLKLHDALEKVAEDEGFTNWHQVTIRRKRDEAVELFLSTRAVVAFDEKDAPNEYEVSQGLLERDDYLGFAADRNFVHAYVNNHDVLGNYALPPSNWSDEHPDILSKAIDAGEVMAGLAWFRVNQDLKAYDTPVDVLKRIKPHCFFPPSYIALRGIFYGVYGERRVLAW